MAQNTWVQNVIDESADGTALSNSTTETSIINAVQKRTFPANTFGFVGKRLRLTAAGRISTVVTSPGTLTLRLKFGSIAVFTSGAMSLNVVAKTNVPWFLECYGEIRSIGASTAATLFMIGVWTSEAVIGAPLPTVGGSGTFVLPFNTAPVVGAGFDSSASQVIDLTAQWGTANAANSILAHTCGIELLN